MVSDLMLCNRVVEEYGWMEKGKEDSAKGDVFALLLWSSLPRALLFKESSFFRGRPCSP